MNRSRIIPYLGFAIIIFMIIGYALFRFLPLVSGPVLQITSPDIYSVTDQDSVTLHIKTERVTLLEIQGLEVDIQKSGTTLYPYQLSEGINRIVVQAQDQYESEKTQSLLVIKKSGKPL